MNGETIPKFQPQGQLRSLEQVRFACIPDGAVAQLMGHKPSAPLKIITTFDCLTCCECMRKKIEAWILEQTVVRFDAKAELGKFRMLAGGAV